VHRIAYNGDVVAFKMGRSLEEKFEQKVAKEAKGFCLSGKILVERPALPLQTCG
jgi:hypothetical protein